MYKPISTLEEAVESLKEYVCGQIYYNDIYDQEKSEDEYTDFDKFCIEHCLSIEIVLDELKKAGLIK